MFFPGRVKMARSERPQGPEFIRFFNPILDSLKQLGGSGRPSEVVDRIVASLQISEERLNETTKSGSQRIPNQIHWARFYLVQAGYLDATQRGVWRLTEKGIATDRIPPDEALTMFRRLHAALQSNHPPTPVADDETAPPIADVPLPSRDHRSELLRVLKALPPSGFERLSQYLLRKSGFERVTVTGRSGDGGIDGIGVVQVTPFVSFKALFQCKRYDGSVGSSAVRDFRGAMAGRADKGIILTTGSFTRDAREEAVREGVPPIELVDGEKLIELFESLQLGLKPRTVYDVDHEFFHDYR
jgi:restriction system protein